VVHVNDTKDKLGSRVDRHAHLGEGGIALEGLAALVNYGWPDQLPFILETPENGSEWDKINLEKLKGLVDK
jgi:deoxyribonuclease-4